MRMSGWSTDVSAQSSLSAPQRICLNPAERKRSTGRKADRASDNKCRQRPHFKVNSLSYHYSEFSLDRLAVYLSLNRCSLLWLATFILLTNLEPNCDSIFSYVIQNPSLKRRLTRGHGRNTKERLQKWGFLDHLVAGLLLTNQKGIWDNTWQDYVVGSMQHSMA